MDERLISRIAELYYIYDINQYEIARKFNFSKAKVCRIIKEAKEKGVIQFSITDYNKRQRELEKQLEDKYGLKEVIIYFNMEDKDYNDDANFIFQEIGKLAASYFNRILENNINIALAWGKTLYNFIENIQIEKKFKNINIFSTLGGVSLTTVEYQNNSLIQMLSNKIGGTCYPIYLPLVLESKEHKEFLTANNNINEILGNMSDIDYYFASLGFIAESSRMYKLGVFDKSFLKELSDKKACGEIGLNFYDIDGNFIKTSIDERAVYLGIEYIKKMKNKIIIAFGKSKVLSTKGFLKTKIADILITDSLTALELLKSQE
ncbi:MAG: sugar-binding transcriptional regulator [Nitrososphaeraceae archaeon]